MLIATTRLALFSLCLSWKSEGPLMKLVGLSSYSAYEMVGEMANRSRLMSE